MEHLITLGRPIAGSQNRVNHKITDLNYRPTYYKVSEPNPNYMETLT